jgi:hypothetical protein
VWSAAGEAVGDDGVAQAAAPDLPGGIGAGELVDLHDHAWLLRSDQRRRHVRAQLLDRRQRRARPHDDRRAHELTPPLVGEPDDTDLGHRRVGEHRGLDLDRRHPLAARADGLGAAAGDGDEAVGIA